VSGRSRPDGRIENALPCVLPAAGDWALAARAGHRWGSIPGCDAVLDPGVTFRIR